MLEPRVLLSADTPFALVAYQSLHDEENDGANAVGDVSVEQIDAATSAEIAAARGGDSGSAQTQTNPSVAWPDSWQTGAADESASNTKSPAAGGLDSVILAPESAHEASAEAARIEQPAAIATAPENTDSGERSTFAGTDQTDSFASTIPVSELARGPPADDSMSSAVIAADAIDNNQLEISVSPDEGEGGLFGVQQLLVSEASEDGLARGPPITEALTDQNLAPVLEEAIRLWAASGLTADVAGRLANLKVAITDLPGGELGEADQNIISLDVTAAGRGWFVDPTPGDSSEFATSLTDTRSAANAGGAAFGRIDLLTVLLHEIGHVAGFGHDSGLAVMAENLAHSHRVLLESNNIGVVTPIGGLVAGASTAAPELDLSGFANGGATITIQVNADGTLNIGGTAVDDGTNVAGITNIVGNALASITLVSPFLDNVWTLTGINSGTLKAGSLGAISFTNIRNLTGGSGRDDYHFNDGGVSGVIIDGSGAASLSLGDYVYISGEFDFQAGIVVRADIATGLPGNISNLLDAAGGLVPQTFKDYIGGLSDASLIEDVDMATLTIGATGVDVFIGVNGPYDALSPDPDTLGLSMSGVDLGFALMTPLVSFGGILPIFYALKATVDSAGLVGIPGVTATATGVEINVNGGSWPEAIAAIPGIPGPVVDFESSFPAAGLTPAGLEIAAGSGSVYLDFPGDGIIAASADNVTLDLGGFVYVSGSFSFEMGGSQIVDVSTGIPGNLAALAGDLFDAFDFLPTTEATALGGLWVESDFSVIHGLEVETIKLGIGDAEAFIGVNGPVSTDPDALGIYAVGVDVGLVLMTPTLADLPGFDQIMPKFYALKATVGSAGLVGIPGVTATATGVEINVNGGSWPEAIASIPGIPGPVVDFEASFAVSAEHPTLGYEIETGGGNSLFIDYAGDGIIAASAVNVTLDLGGFVYVSGSFAFEMGGSQIVTVSTGLSGNAAAALGTVFAPVIDQFNDVADATTGMTVASDFSSISGLEVETIKIGIGNAEAFIGVNGPVSTDPDALGLYATGADFGLVLMTPTLADLPGLDQVMPKFYALKATVSSAGLVGIPGVTATATGVEINVNGGSWPEAIAAIPGIPGPVVDFEASFPVSAEHPTLGYEIETGGGNSLFIDYAGDGIIAASAANVTLDLGGFVYLSGSFSFEMGGSQIVTVSTGISYGAGSVIGVAIKPVKDAFDAVAGSAGLAVANDFSSISGLEVETIKLGIGGASAFVGADPAIGLSMTGVDVGMVLMTPTLAELPGFDLIMPKFYALKANVATATLVGLDGLVDATVKGIEINVNSGAWSSALSTNPLIPGPAVNFAASFPVSGEHSTLGYEVETGPASSVYLDYSSELIRAVAHYVDLEVAGALQLTGSIAFARGPPANVMLTDGSQVAVTTMTIGAANVYGFVGIGPYWADSNNDGVITATEHNSTAVGLAITNVNFALAVMVSQDLNHPGVFLALKLSVPSVTLVGLPGVTATGSLDAQVNVGASLGSGLAVVNFAASFPAETAGNDADGDGKIDPVGFEVNTGSTPISLDFTGFLISFHLHGQLDLLAVSLVGDFGLTITADQISIHANATLDLKIGSQSIFDFGVVGDLQVSSSGLVASIGVTLQTAIPGGLGITLNATYRLDLNTTASAATVGGNSVPTGLRIHAHGDLTVLILTLTGDFDITIAPDKFTIGISATTNVFGTSLGVNGFAGLYYDAHPGLAFSIQMTLGGGPNVTVVPVSGFSISANFQLVINTSGVARTDINSGALIPANSFLIGATNVSVNLFGFTLAGDLVIEISAAGLSIPHFSLVLDFFGAFSLNVAGSFGTSGNFSFTALASITFLDPAVFGFNGTVSVTFTNSGFSGSVSATFGAFGIQVHGDGNFTITDGLVKLAVTISLQITPAFHVHIGLPWPLPDIDFDVPALIISGTWTNTFGALTSAPAVPPPPALATRVGNALRLNIGADVGARGAFYPATDESYNLTLVGPGSSTGQKIKVSGLGYDQIYDDITSIVANDTGSGTTFISIASDITVPVSINAGVTVSGSNHFILGGGAATVRGGSNFDWIDAGAGGGTFYGGSGDSKIIDNYGSLTARVSGYDSYTISDASLRYLSAGGGAKTMTMGGSAGVRTVILDGAANAAFVVTSGWTRPSLTLNGAGSASSVTGSTTNNYTLTNSALTNGAGITVNLNTISVAKLSGSSTFTVSGWTGSGEINGFGGADQVIAANDANFTLTDASLARSSGGSFTLTGIERAELTGGASQNTFNVSNWTGAATLNGAANDDIYNITLKGSGSGTTTISDSSGANDAVTVNGPAIAGTLVVTSSQVKRAAETVNYTSTERLVANGASVVETFQIDSTSIPTTIYGFAANDQFFVNGTSSNLTLDGGAGSDTFNVKATGGATITTIYTGAGSEANTVNAGSNAPATGGTVNSIAGQLVVNGQSGADTLNLDDTADTGANAGTLTATTLTGLGTGGITYSGLEALNLNLGSGADDFTIQATHAGVTVLNTFNGADRVAIRATSGNTTVNTGSGDDTINIGSAATVATNSGGTLNAMLGALTINAEGGASDIVNFDDTADASANTGTLSSTLLTGLGTSGVTYSGLETLNLNFGSGADDFTIQATHAGVTVLNTFNGADRVAIRATSGNTTVNTGSGDDTINIGSAATVATNSGGTLNAMLGALTINAEGGASDIVNFDDTADASANTGTLSSTLLTGLGTSGVTYSGLETLNINLGSGSDTFFVASTHAGLTTLYAGAGNDNVYLATIAGETRVKGEADDDTIKVNVNADGSERIVGGATANGVGALLDLDGGLGSDSYLVYFAGSAYSASHPVSLINVHDTGGNGNGTDFLEIYGTDNPDVTDNFLVRRNFIALVPPAAVGTGGTAERINYDDTLNAGIAIYARAGDDYFAFDDTSAALTVDGGDGADTFQIGQMFQSERVSTPIILANGSTAASGTVAAGDEVRTVHTTRGYLTPGVQAPTTIYGGDGNDQFIIFSNQGPLGLFGEDGDDRFVVRAFALYGSQAVDPNRPGTNINAGQGADNVEYSVNAPVAIDGGDGRDTIVVVGTEFSDHIVITDQGIYGAGLFVTYTGIEEIEIHAAEGNDHISVLSTPAGVVTRIFGDLGSDTFDVGGQAGAVVSRDLQGHSGIIDNVVISGDVTYTGIPVEGVAVDVADNDAPGVVITPSGGATVVAESDFGIGLRVDAYTVVLAAPPTTNVYLTVSAPVSSLKDQNAGSRSVKVYTDASNAQVNYKTPARAIELHFTAANWNQPQTVFVQAENDAAPEGTRFAFIQHSISATSAAGYAGLALPNVAAKIIDDDAASAVLVPLAEDTLGSERVGAVNPILEGNTTLSSQSFALILTNGAGSITVDGGSQLAVDGASSSFSFTAGSSAQLVTLRAADDGLVEGPHRGIVTASVTSGAAEPDQLEVRIADTNSPGVLILPTNGSTRVIEGAGAGLPWTDAYSVALTRAPAAGTTVEVQVTAVPTPTTNAQLLGLAGGITPQVTVGNSVLTFTSANWSTPQMVTVTAIDDTVVDGGDIQAFARTIQSVDGIRGPLIIEGGIDPSFDSRLPEPRLYFGETNLQQHINLPNPNFTAIESDQIDTLLLYNNDAVAAQTGTLTQTRLFGLGMGSDLTVFSAALGHDVTIGGGITYSNLETLSVYLGKGVDSFEVQSTHAGVTVIDAGAGNDVVAVRTVLGHATILGGAGDDQISLGAPGASQLTIDRLQALVTIDGGAGGDTVNIDDRGDTNNNVGILDTTTLTGLDLAETRVRTLEVSAAAAGTFTLTIDGHTAALSIKATAAELRAALTGFGLPGVSDIVVDRAGELYTIGFLVDETLPAGALELSAGGSFISVGASVNNRVQTVALPAATGNHTVTIGSGVSAPTFSITVGDSAAVVRTKILEALNPGFATGTGKLSTEPGGYGNKDVSVVRFGTTYEVTFQGLLSGNRGTPLTFSVAPRATATDTTFSVNAIGGTFRLDLAGSPLQTSPLAWNASAAVVQNVLRGILGSSTLTVEQTGSTYTVTGSPTALSSVDEHNLVAPIAVAARTSGVNYYGVDTLNLNLGAGSDVLNIRGTAAVTNVFTNDGDDRTYVSSLASETLASAATTDFLAGNLDRILGTLNLDAGAGRQLLMISDEAAIAGDNNVRITDLPVGGLPATEIAITGLTPAPAITYQAAASGNFADGITIWTGWGADTISVDGTQNRGDGSLGALRTATTLNAGLGDDHITAALDNADGFFVLNTQGPENAYVGLLSDRDTVDASSSTRSLIIFGGQDDDAISGGTAADIFFGDRGLVTYYDGASPVAVFGNGGPGDSTDGVERPLGFVTTASPAVGGNDTVYGLAGRDIIFGGFGNDVLDASAADVADDILVGDNGQALFTAGIITRVDTSATSLGGDDTLTAGKGANIAIGGVGEDTIYAGGDALPDILVGDNGTAIFDPANGRLLEIYTTAAADAGADVLTTGDGSSVVFGGSFSDLITSGAGNDIIVGDNGSAFFDADTYRLISIATTVPQQPTGAGRVVDGVTYDDVINAGEGSNVIFGGSFNDLVITLGGDDIAVGDNGFATFDPNGILRAIETNATTYGGDDRILTGAGADVVLAGSGSDTVDSGAEALGDISRDVVVGDNGRAQFDTLGRLTYITTTVPDTGGNDTIFIGAGDNVAFGGVGDDTITAGNGNDIIVGDNGSARFDAVTLYVALVQTSDVAFGGNDAISSGAGDDLVLGGAAGDEIHAGEGADIVLGDNGLVTYDASGRSQWVQVTDPAVGGNDRIEGNGGTDIVIGGTGADILSGDTGSGENSGATGARDLMFGDHALIQVDGVAGSNFTAIFTAATDGGGNDVMYGNGGDDVLLGQQGSDTIRGGDGDDDLWGGHNVVFGADAGDVMVGGAGADVMLGDNGIILRTLKTNAANSDDWVLTQAPFSDVVRNVTRFDDWDLVAGDDMMYGDAGSDRMWGQRGDDILSGGAHDDEMIGGLGNDEMYGDAGADVMLGDVGVISRALNPDGTARLNPDGSWHKDVLLTDMAYLSGSIALNGPDMPVGDQATVDALLQADVTLLTGVYNADGTRRYNSYGTPENRALLLELLADGNDAISGGDGNDAIYGQRGDDTVSGDAGGDFLAGGLGADHVNGGDGDDIVVGDQVIVDSDRPAVPNVTHGYLVIRSAGSTDILIGIVVGDLGTTIVPMIAVVPNREINAPAQLLPHLFDYAMVPEQNQLAASDGGALVPFASLVSEWSHHVPLLSGNDILTGGAGNDTLVGDDLVAIARTVAFDSATMAEAEYLTRRLVDVSDDYSDMIHAQYELIYDHYGVWGKGWHDKWLDSWDKDGYYRVVIDQTLSFGNDSLDGGAGQDVLIGDNSIAMTPAFSVPADLAAEFEMFADGVTWAGDEIAHAITDLAGIEHHQRDTVISVTKGKKTEQKIEGHIDLLVTGNDTIHGGDGNDLVIGDAFMYRAPLVVLVAPVGDVDLDGDDHRHDKDDQKWASASGWWDRDWDDDGGYAWSDHKYHDGFRDGYDKDRRHGHSLDAIDTGRDTIFGGAGDDLVWGDSLALVTDDVVRALGIRNSDYNHARHYAEEGVERISALTDETSYWFGGYRDHHDDKHDGGDWWKDGHSNWFHGANGLYADVIRGGDGDDVIFGQQGDDALYGEKGNDWLIGGAGSDYLDGGADSKDKHSKDKHSKDKHSKEKNRLYSGDNSSSELRNSIAAAMGNWDGAFRNLALPGALFGNTVIDHGSHDHFYDYDFIKFKPAARA